MRGNQWHDSVATGPKLVHPIGHDISHSTNRGFKVRRSSQDVWPSGVGWSGGEDWESQSPTTSLNGLLFFSIVSSPAWIERWSRAIGVGHIAAT